MVDKNTDVNYEEFFSWVPFFEELFLKIAEIDSKDRHLLVDIFNEVYHDDDPVTEFNPLSFMMWATCPTRFDGWGSEDGWSEAMALIKEKFQLTSEIPKPFSYMRHWWHFGYDEESSEIFWNFCRILALEGRVDEELFNTIIKGGYWTQFSLGHAIFLAMPNKFFDTTTPIIKILGISKNSLKRNYASYITFQEAARSKFVETPPYELFIKSSHHTVSEWATKSDNAAREALSVNINDIPLMRTLSLSDLQEEERAAVEKISKENTTVILEKAKDAQEYPEEKTVSVRVYIRDSAVIAHSLERADGRCENCKKPAPFKTKEGRLYLEVHHKQPLAEKGKDSINNTIALCPNCHREMHYGEKKEN